MWLVAFGIHYFLSGGIPQIPPATKKSFGEPKSQEPVLHKKMEEHRSTELSHAKGKEVVIGITDEEILSATPEKSSTSLEPRDGTYEEKKKSSIVTIETDIDTPEVDDANDNKLEKSTSCSELLSDGTKESNERIDSKVDGNSDIIQDCTNLDETNNGQDEGDTTCKPASDGDSKLDLVNNNAAESSLITEELTEVRDEPRTMHAQEKQSTSLSILFPAPSSPSRTSVNAGYTNTSWKANEASRRLVFCGEASRFENGRFFWSSSQFVRRTMALFVEPPLLVIAREPKNSAEVREALREIDNLDPILQDSQILSREYLIAETVLELNVCKLRLSMLTAPTSIVIDPSESDGDGSQRKILDCRRMSCFEFIHPAENILISAMEVDNSDTFPEVALSEKSRSTYAITSRWEDEISNVLLSLHGSLGNKISGELTWRHQLILGTLHSHVVSGNYTLLEQALIGKGNPDSPYRKIDERDEAGLTPLHYACYRRSHKAVSILLNAGADCSLPTSKGKNSPCHICCEQLDTKSLSMILSCSKPRRADPNALNEMSETPMYVALTRGDSSAEMRNPIMCLKALEAWGGQIVILPYDQCSSGLSPIFKLSSSWDDVGLKSGFQFYDCQYPIPDEQADGFGRSLGAVFQYPFHAAIVSLRFKVMKISNKNDKNVFTKADEKSISDTLKLLSDVGFELNERLEEHSTNPTELNEMVGFTPLQILAAAALDLLHVADSLEDNLTNVDLIIASEIIRSSSDILVARGARVWVDAPTIARPNRGPPRKGNSDHPCESSVILHPIELSNMNMESNKDLVKVLGGIDRLAAIRAKWFADKTTKGSGQIFLPGKGLSIQLVDSMLPGGSHQTSCAVCWKKFGKIINRKHVCRASRRYLCEECSGKAVFIDNDLCRVSDGQFNLAKYNLLCKEGKDRKEVAEKRKERKTRIEEAQSKRSDNTLKARAISEDAAREELFGSVGRAVKNLFVEEVVEQDSAQAVNDDVNGVMNSLSQTRNAFVERGQKLNNLVEKTSALNNTSEEFAKMAKELADSQEKGIFGW